MITHTYIGDAVISTSDLVAIAALKMLNWTEGGINAGRQDMLPPDTPTAMADAIVSLRTAQCEFDFCLDARRQVKTDPHANVNARAYAGMAISSGAERQEHWRRVKEAEDNHYAQIQARYVNDVAKLKEKKKGFLGGLL